MTTEIAERYDIIIIGARCAGATLAALAGRAGARVLLADQAALPSDLVLSTHTLHPSGARVLARLGILARLRALAPPIRTLRIGRGSATLDVQFSADDAELCPRRRSLDGLLLEAARENAPKPSGSSATASASPVSCSPTAPGASGACAPAWSWGQMAAIHS